MLNGTALDTVLSANATTCFVVGGALNLLLVWLTMRRSPAELRPYARVLLQVAVVNIAFLTATALCSPVQLSSADGSVTYAVGWAARSNDGSASTRAHNFALTATWCYMHFLTHYSAVVPF